MFFALVAALVILVALVRTVRCSQQKAAANFISSNNLSHESQRLSATYDQKVSHLIYQFGFYASFQMWYIAK